MADISKIVSNGTTYNIKDAVGRTIAESAAVRSNYLSTQTKSVDNITIAASSTTNVDFTITRSGYTPLGIVSLYLNNASSSGTRQDYCHEVRWYISPPNSARVTLRNYCTTGAAKIKVIIKVLYAKTG